MKNHKSQITNKLLIVLFISLTLLSCAKEDIEVRNVVMAYNKMIAEALSKPDFRIMEYFTSTQELLRIEAYITYLKKDKKLMVSDLDKIEFISVDISGPKKATVKTTEEWTYSYIDEKTRQPITEKEYMKYENVYHLIKESGHWVVDKINVKEK